MPSHDAIPLGTDTSECASKPELMMDLALADLSKRVVLCQGLWHLAWPDCKGKVGVALDLCFEINR